MASSGFERVVEEAMFSKDQVYAVFKLEADAVAVIEDIESKIDYQGYVVVNDAINRMKPKSMKYCIFSKGFLEPPTDQMVILMDKVYGLCGQDVPPHMKDSISEDAVWVSETFVMYPDKISGEEVQMVLQPYNLRFLNELDGVSGALCYNPSLAGNEYLRKALNFNGPMGATSTLVAFDTSF